MENRMVRQGHSAELSRSPYHPEQSSILRSRTSTEDGRGTERKLSIAGTREQTACRFCRRRIKYIDYKDIETLQKLLTNRGKIYSRKRSGNCAKCQRKAKKAIKRARYMALLPFTA